MAGHNAFMGQAQPCAPTENDRASDYELPRAECYHMAPIDWGDSQARRFFRLWVWRCPSTGSLRYVPMRHRDYSGRTDVGSPARGELVEPQRVWAGRRPLNSLSA